MGTGQMMLVLLSVILFVTIMHSTLNNLMTQSEFIFKNMLLLQAEKISDRFINMVDMQLKSGAKTFAEIKSEYVSFDTTFAADYTDFNVQVQSFYCNLDGTTAGGTTMFQRLDVRVAFEFAGDSLRVGTAANPVSAVFAETGL